MTKQKPAEIIAKQFLNKILESNIMPWEMPWDSEPCVSVSSNKSYGGRYNRWRLRYEQHISNYSSNLWGTYNAWKKLNRNVKKDEKSTIVMSNFMNYYKDKKKVSYTKYKEMTIDQKKGVNQFLSIGYHRVFNFDQTNGEELPKRFNKVEFEKYQIEDIDTIIENMPNSPKIVHGCDQAYYSSTHHTINMPNQEDFIKKADKFHKNKSLGIPLYYSTLMHEIIHSTGHPSILKRNMEGGKGGTAYALEELTAEIGTNMLMQHFEINTDKTDAHSISYIKGWSKAFQQKNKENREEKIEMLKENYQALIKACTQAEKAIEHILQKEHKVAEEVS